MPPRKGKKTSKKQSSKENNKENADGIKPVDLTDLFTNYSEPKEEEYRMFSTDQRRESFTNWPFDAAAGCNPSTLAEAGFYHIPSNESPDATRCFCCFKELDGWELDDDPWSEHKKRSPDCNFLTLKKDVLELTMDEFIKLLMERNFHKARKLCHAKQQEIDVQAATVRSELLKLNPKS